MNNVRLRELKEVLKNAERLHFCSDSWINWTCKEHRITTIEELHNTSGARACAGGYAALHKPFNDQGLRLDYEGSRPHIIYENDNGYREYGIFKALDTFFDLGPTKTLYLFASFEYPGCYATSEDVIERIEILLRERKEDIGFFRKVKSALFGLFR